MLGAKLTSSAHQSLQSEIITLIMKRPAPQVVKIKLLEMTRSEFAIPLLLEELTKGSESYHSSRAAFSLWVIGNPKATEGLLEIITSSEDNISKQGAFFALRTSIKGNIPQILIEFLSHDEPSIVEETVKLLGEIENPQAAHHLIKLLGKEDIPPSLCSNIARSLGQLGDNSAFESLIELIVKDQDSSSYDFLLCQHESARALGRINPERAFLRLIDELNSQDYKLCQRISNAIENLEIYDATPTILQKIDELADSPDDIATFYYIAWSIAKLLVKLCNKSTIPSLIKLLKSKLPEIRKSAAFALGEIGDESAISPLLKSLDYILLSDDDKRYMYFALAKLDYVEARSKVIDSLSSNDFHMACEAAKILAEIQSLEATPDLQRLLDEEHMDLHLYSHFATSLSKIDKEIAVPYLFNSVINDESWSRRMVIDALSSINKPEILSRGAKILRDITKRDKTREASAEILGRLGQQESLEILGEQLNDSKNNKNLFWYIVEAIGNIGAPSYLARFWAMQQQETTDASFLSAIANIQSRCKFYNYEVAHGLIPQGQPISLYFSYAPTDEALQTQLANHLNLLERQGIITSWNDRQILPGDEPAQVINQHLNTADIILLLIQRLLPRRRYLLRPRNPTSYGEAPNRRSSRHPHSTASRGLDWCTF